MTGIRIDLEKLKGAIKNQSNLAKRMNIARYTLYRKLNGEVGITFNDLNRIAYHLERNTEDFIVQFNLSELADVSKDKA